MDSSGPFPLRAAARQPPASGIQTTRVLIADDHALMREGLKALLSAASDVQVVAEANDGRDAMRLVGELSPDVILMDISMPGMNGVEALDAMRSNGVRAGVVILSMHSSAEHVFRAFEAGADGYLLKDAAGPELVAAVRAVRAGRRYLSEALRGLEIAFGTQRGDSPLERLSSRERQVLQLVAEGKSSAEIAGILHLSRKSVDTYRSRLMKKLELADIPALVKFALQHGITSLD